MSIHYQCLPLPPSFDLLALQHNQRARYPFLLESVVRAQAPSFDILFGFPQQTLCLDRGGQLTGPYAAESADFLTSLELWWQAEGNTPFDSHSPLEAPFVGGWFVFLGYELAAQIEPGLQLPLLPVAQDFPTAFATRIPAAIVIAHSLQQIWIISEQAELLPVMCADIQAAVPPISSNLLQVQALWEADESEFLTAVQCIKRYIQAGDVFQVNLSRLWHAQLASDTQPWQLYQRLRQTNPAPFAGLVHYHDKAIVSSSPERLVKVKDRQVEVRPIAGTHPRAAGIQDQALATALLAHPKERAEHIMLIDLERNDLGRVCEPGSIHVNELMVLESYRHVHHIVSNVRGQLRAGTTPAQVLRAVFPGGTITGCPKVRCMQIIAEQEQAGRGPYTGAMGYLNRDGSLDFNILIRTVVYQPQHLWFRAGSGIVADSIAERELAETRAKAKGLLAALMA